MNKSKSVGVIGVIFGGFFSLIILFLLNGGTYQIVEMGAAAGYPETERFGKPLRYITTGDEMSYTIDGEVIFWFTIVPVISVFLCCMCGIPERSFLNDDGAGVRRNSLAHNSNEARRITPAVTQRSGNTSPFISENNNSPRNIGRNNTDGFGNAITDIITQLRKKLKDLEKE